MKEITYKSTRGGEENISASLAILKGLADDGGLFMPNVIPKFDFNIKDLIGKSYKEVAYEIMKLFFTDFTKEELQSCIENAYDSKFDTEEIVPLVKADNAYYLELFHGNTIAFKDMALSILPHLMTTVAKKNGLDKKIVILTATSGDTGKAAMAGFADIKNTAIIVFYTKGGVSEFQRLQMITQKGNNTHVVAVHGNFDDAQTGVKNIFNDKAFENELNSKGIWLSSANSINIGRLVPQIVYYVYGYVKLLEENEIAQNEEINVCVPTGNFGNILAAKFAKLMGLPIKKLICASNENKVLYDFFKTGRYDKNRDFILTTSPSMDILISSNLERLIYLSCDMDSVKTLELMKGLAQNGFYEISDKMKEFMSDFEGGYATETENFKAIRKLYEDTGYVIDTHTGVAFCVYEKYRKESNDKTKTIIASTASPYKFSESVIKAISKENLNLGEWESIDLLEKSSNVEVPRAVNEVKNTKILHNLECDIDNMKTTVAEILKI